MLSQSLIRFLGIVICFLDLIILFIIWLKIAEDYSYDKRKGKLVVLLTFSFIMTYFLLLILLGTP